MRFQALAIDTEVIKRQGYNFERGILSLLKQLGEKGVDIVFSRVTLSETRSHLFNETWDDYLKYRSAISKLSRSGLAGSELGSFETSSEHISKIIDARLDTFVAAVKAKVVELNTLACSDVFDLYANSKPPFSSKKKSEFPDAMALMSLEQWAKAHSKSMIVVSQDNDWKSFCKDSPLLHQVDELETALSMLTEHEAHVAELIADFLAAHVLGRNSTLTNLFTQAVARQVESASYDLELNSSYDVEAEVWGVRLEGLRVPDHVEPEVLVEYEDEIVIQLTVVVDIAIEAHVSFSIYDSVDKDSIYFGGRDLTIAEEAEFDLIVTIARDNEGMPILVNIDRDTQLHSFNVGQIEPEWEYDQD